MGSEMCIRDRANAIYECTRPEVKNSLEETFDDGFCFWKECRLINTDGSIKDPPEECLASLTYPFWIPDTSTRSWVAQGYILHLRI